MATQALFSSFSFPCPCWTPSADRNDDAPRRPGAPPPYDARYMLRPETVESLFIAYRLTGDDKYRQYGWKIFEAIERHCRVEEGGYTTVLNVDALPVEHEDKMETFLMVSSGSV